jgi:MraZ protein
LSFTGEFRHTIDAKGRLIVPSRIRVELAGDRAVLTKWLDGCIAIWSEQGWHDIETRLREQGNSSQAARDFVRMVAASARPDEVDRQGRITIPQNLRDHADVERDVIVIGVLNRGEIWSPDRWEQRQGAVEEGRLEQLAEQLDF